MDLSNGPNWELIALGAISLLIAIIGGYAKGISGRVDKIEESHHSLKELVLKDYHNKDEIRDLLSQLRQSLTALHQRFDRAGFPHIYNIKGEGSDRGNTD